MAVLLTASLVVGCSAATSSDAQPSPPATSPTAHA